MKKMFSLVTFMVICSALYAQEIPQSDTHLRDGRKAISFIFDGFDLASFNGGIGGKYWLSDNLAFKGSLDLDYVNSDSDDSQNDANVERSSKSIGLSLGIEKHLRMKKVSPYFGGSLGIAIANSNSSSLGSSESSSYAFSTVISCRLNL